MKIPVEPESASVSPWGRWHARLTRPNGEANACLVFSAIHLSVDHPLFDCIPIKTIIVADLERRNLTFANHSIDRGPMNFQKLGYFGNRHDAAGRGIVAGFHCASAAAWRRFIDIELAKRRTTDNFRSATKRPIPPDHQMPSPDETGTGLNWRRRDRPRLDIEPPFLYERTTRGSPKRGNGPAKFSLGGIVGPSFCTRSRGSVAVEGAGWVYPLFAVGVRAGAG
jgi:hypothetical protein